LHKISVLIVHVAIVRQCTKQCKQLRKGLFKQKIIQTLTKKSTNTLWSQLWWKRVPKWGRVLRTKTFVGRTVTG